MAERDAVFYKTQGAEWWTPRTEDDYLEIWSRGTTWHAFYVDLDGKAWPVAGITIDIEKPQWGFRGIELWPKKPRERALFVSGVHVDSSGQFKKQFRHLAGAVQSLGPSLLDLTNIWDPGWIPGLESTWKPDIVKLDAFLRPALNPASRELLELYRQCAFREMIRRTSSKAAHRH